MSGTYLFGYFPPSFQFPSQLARSSLVLELRARNNTSGRHEHEGQRIGKPRFSQFKPAPFCPGKARTAGDRVALTLEFVCSIYS